VELHFVVSSFIDSQLKRVPYRLLLWQGEFMRLTASMYVLLAAFTMPVGLYYSVPVLAQTGVDQGQHSPAGMFIQTIGNRAISVMANKSLSAQQRTQKYQDILQASFDMETIGRFVLGRAWESATSQQQQTFMRLFQQLVLKTYGDRISFYSGEKFEVTQVRQESDRDSVVNSDVTHTDGSAPTKVDWRVRQENSKLAVIDVTVEGVSQSITQRQEYMSILQRNNGDMNALLDMMRQRLQSVQQQSSRD
jgi:phospholipid transport system substrate-binding protein